MPIALAPLIIPLAVLFSFLVLYAIRNQSQVLIRSIFDLIGRILRAIPLVGGWLAGHVDEAVYWIEARIAATARAVEAPVAAFFGYLAAMVEYAAFTTAYLAESALEAFHHLRHVVIPRLLRAYVLPLTVALGGAKAISRWGTRELGRLEAELEHDFRVAIRRAQAAFATAAHALDIPLGLDIPGQLRGLWHRVRRTEKLILGGTIAALMLRTLARRLPWYRCSNVDKLARNVCRMDRGLLDSLLADTLLIAGGISLVQFAREVGDVTDETTAAISWFIRELHNKDG